MYNLLRRDEKSLALPPWVILGSWKKKLNSTPNPSVYGATFGAATRLVLVAYMWLPHSERVAHSCIQRLAYVPAVAQRRREEKVYQDLNIQYSIFLSIVYVYDEVFRQLQVASRAAHHKCRDALWLSQRRKKSQHVERVDHT